jgi:hypothetical protein
MPSWHLFGSAFGALEMKKPDNGLPKSDTTGFLTTEVHPNSDCIINGIMHIESLDLLKFYEGNSRKVSIAVRVVDNCAKPIDRAKVGMKIVLSEGGSISFTRTTDKDGLSTFDLIDVPKGRIDVGVIGVNHPKYQFDKRRQPKSYKSTNI